MFRDYDIKYSYDLKMFLGKGLEEFPSLSGNPVYFIPSYDLLIDNHSYKEGWSLYQRQDGSVYKKYSYYLDGVDFIDTKGQLFYQIQSKAKKEIKCKKALSVHLWNDISKMNETYNVIYGTIKDYGDGSEVVPMLPFEVWLVERGFNMMYFDYMNAYHPCLNIGGLKETSSPNSYKIQNGLFTRTRYYSDGVDNFYFGFGCNGVNFYFTSTKFDGYKPVPYKKEEFEMAFIGNIKSI